ncbi:MAG TPA: STAS domain-containing protein [Armatimonadota bacterium]|nr:STAS domain-containing protein [Armatimonadota bacterium]
MSEAKLECYTRRDGRRTIFSMEGTLDVATAPAGQEALLRFITEHGPDAIVDTSRMDFIDSKGLGVLIGAAKAARDAGGSLFLPNAATPVRKILETCGLMSLFPSELPPEPPAPPAETPQRPPLRPAAPARAPVRPARRTA